MTTSCWVKQYFGTSKPFENCLRSGALNFVPSSLKDLFVKIFSIWSWISIGIKHWFNSLNLSGIFWPSAIFALLTHNSCRFPSFSVLPLLRTTIACNVPVHDLVRLDLSTAYCLPTYLPTYLPTCLHITYIRIYIYAYIYLLRSKNRLFPRPWSKLDQWMTSGKFVLPLSSISLPTEI